MRIYQATVTPSSHVIEENDKLPPLKQCYEDSFFEHVLLTETDLLGLIACGRIAKCELVGKLAKAKDLK